ncbi:NAD-dependent succinate-semialdehyde dehydrogenase [Agrobacterium rhizogenes]|uniref:Aldehyde dehydrogenase n=1 Tax=Pararhizobium polonicum TaxID=1612624 RepID=A0A1C7P854_9HYPH|nr:MULTISPECIES: NAD-dependent succinate-semialdehyde dehydrogenase [Rhizobium/Agrobacterium group]NTH16482.1 NAD-dependent succinate-semialdehyde dehydrogenase [Rhizobium rhizogenes]OBZ97418.1 aldehyde dehydrogenase [Pararhizobium polonicum]TRB17759.1 NAD-dependent succinate-semialdehyde dehydrogenase [Rhizobium rhizogenes]
MGNHTEAKLFINGEWKARAGAPIINPADETELGIVPFATENDLAAAVEAAEIGFKTWSHTSPSRRSEIIRDAAARIRANIEIIARDMTLEQGKPLNEARNEVRRSCQVLEWDAEEGRRTYGRVIPAEQGLHNSVKHLPIGPVAAFTPWNYPLSSVARKVGGALAAGCSVVLKASEETPAAAVHLVNAFAEAGLPEGVLNLVFGNPSQISRFFIAHRVIRMLAFTGSVPVGKSLAAQAGEFMKPCLMELGGHSPVIVCDDVDPREAGIKSALAKASNAGQICTAPTRWFVAASHFEEFADQMATTARSVRIGNGLDPETQMGPLANARRIAAMQDLISDAVKKGADVLSGGERAANKGYYWPLTVLANVPDDARIMYEEPFGPVALVNPVSSVAEAVSKANSLEFGLAGYALTHSADNIAYLTDHLEVGNFAINQFVSSLPETPFGGMKDSGYGREGGTEGLLNYTITRSISHKTRSIEGSRPGLSS